MKHSDISHTENTFGIHLNNKTYAINNSNSNAVMIGPVLSTQVNQSSSTILGTALNTSRPNSAILTKPISGSNMLGQLTYLSPSNTSIKVVNLSKCQQLPNPNKDSTNIATNNAINVQFVTPMFNNNVSKINNSAVSELTSSANQACTRFTMVPHGGTVTIIPQQSESSSIGVLNSHLMRNTRYALTGARPSPPTVRAIAACTASIVTQPDPGKLSVSKTSPTKCTSINNYTINKSDHGNTAISIKDLTANRHPTPITNDQSRNITKTTPIKPIICTITSSSNIRVALTSSLTNSKVNLNPTKIQLISPKSRKQSASPIIVSSDGKSTEVLIGSKDENAENPAGYNTPTVCYSPTRKRARKQHLKTVNNKLQKLTPNTNCDPTTFIDVIRNTANTKVISTPITIAPITTTTITKFANISTQNKVEDNSNTPTSIPPNNIVSNPQIIIPLKHPIQICASKMPSIVSVYNNSHTTINNSILNSSSIKNNQVQIITQSSHPPHTLQLSPIGNNLILSPLSFGKTLVNISPQKVIHIGASKVINNHFQTPKNEKAASSDNVEKEALCKPTVVMEKEPSKVEVVEIKSETTEDVNVKYSLFSQKYQWNAQRMHFEKESDVKIKKSRTFSTVKHSNTENQEDDLSTNDIDINDTSWQLYQASRQFLLQKDFDEENLLHFRKLKEKFDIKPHTKQDYDEPIFEKVCLHHRQHYVQLPDQLDSCCFSEYTDPKLFGISDDIINHHINISLQSHDTQPHQCSESCLLYLSEVSTETQPPKIRKIIDLIEGLIVKEKKIIEKESEINNQCLRLLQSSVCVLQNPTEKVKVFNDDR